MPSPVIIIFGATGDLAKRKLIPALCRLHAQGALDERTSIIAIGRRDYNDEDIRRELGEFVKERGWESFRGRIMYHRLEFSDAAAYGELKRKVRSDHRIFYLATAPESFGPIVENLRRAGLAEKDPKQGWHRVVFEKPFGYDLASAQKLNRDITRIFPERQIYRIDHYLGKELVQNILVLRFTNPIFEALWNAEHIDNVQIVSAEDNGVLDRGGYYDKSGALRDMVQNHLAQLLSLVAMEQPKRMDADAIRDMKVKALKAVVRDATLARGIVLGQYTAGKANGQSVPDYTAEKGVVQGSRTETFVALKLLLGSKRWKGVPFYLKTGKALGRKYAQIVITFKAAECALFCGRDGRLAPNRLVIRIQPDEGVSLQFNLKEQGADQSALPYKMDFSHEAEFGMNTPEAYERLLADVLRGDQTLFTRWDEVEQAWRIVDKLRMAKGVRLHPYPAGSDGPEAARELLARDGRAWSDTPAK